MPKFIFFYNKFCTRELKMSGERRAKYKPVQSLVAPGRFVILYGSDAYIIFILLWFVKVARSDRSVSFI